jgi:hypothetical protein
VVGGLVVVGVVVVGPVVAGAAVLPGTTCEVGGEAGTSVYTTFGFGTVVPGDVELVTCCDAVPETATGTVVAAAAAGAGTVVEVLGSDPATGSGPTATVRKSNDVGVVTEPGTDAAERPPLATRRLPDGSREIADQARRR